MEIDKKLERFLKEKSLEDLGALRQLVSSICMDYDKSLTNYATLNNDFSFKDAPSEIEERHKRRNKLFDLLMAINAIIEDRLFKLYA